MKIPHYSRRKLEELDATDFSRVFWMMELSDLLAFICADKYTVSLYQILLSLHSPLQLKPISLQIQRQKHSKTAKLRFQMTKMLVFFAIAFLFCVDTQALAKTMKQWWICVHSTASVMRNDSLSDTCSNKSRVSVCWIHGVFLLQKMWRETIYLHVLEKMIKN